MSELHGSIWSDSEIDLIVADYFAMLCEELARRPFVKARHNSMLQQATGRSHRSIEFKHQNISAVLQKLGQPWIIGYKPKSHYQAALVEGVRRWFSVRSDWAPPLRSDALAGASDDRPLWIGPAPAAAPPSSSAELPALQRLVRHFDPAARDARNRALGAAGEERVLHYEHARLRGEDRADLARRVRWVAAEDGDGAGYDILSFNRDGSERLLEVKTTNGWERTPFHLSRNECALAAERPEAFRLFRVYDFAREPRAFEIAPPLTPTLILTPQSFLAQIA